MCPKFFSKCITLNFLFVFYRDKKKPEDRPKMTRSYLYLICDRSECFYMFSGNISILKKWGKEVEWVFPYPTEVFANLSSILASG